MSSIIPKTNFNFMSTRWFWLAISIALVILSIQQLMTTGQSKYGIDFVGGTDLVVKFEEEIDTAAVRAAVEKANIGEVVVQKFNSTDLTKNSSEYSIRVKGTNENNSINIIKETLKGVAKNHTVVREEYVGPVVGEKIKKDALYSIFFAVLGLLIYISFRFEFKYAFGAVISVFHDVLIAAGILILFGGEISAGVLAALLTILGYSVNDTIIVYDRIRENLELKKAGTSVGNMSLSKMPLSAIINLSVNQTLSRTILTSLTVLFTCLALWLFGGGAIEDLAFVLTVGVFVGTYSSIFIAAPVVLGFTKEGK